VFGKNTEEAMCAGVFWSAIEAIRGIVARMQSIQPEPCSVIATGGDMAGFLPHLGDDVHFEPHLVLAGLWLASSHGPSEASA
jgi:pantothenate kinase type III